MAHLKIQQDLDGRDGGPGPHVISPVEEAFKEEQEDVEMEERVEEQGQRPKLVTPAHVQVSDTGAVQ